MLASFLADSFLFCMIAAMTRKKIALLAFFVPFFLGGAFNAICIASDLFSNPDKPVYQMLLATLIDFLYGGFVLGLLSLAVCFSVIGLFALMRKIFQKKLHK